jgi:RNA polymerase sigma-70 factor (ECF subfamily)
MLRESVQFRKILAEYGDSVCRIARTLLGDPRDAEEAVQDAFLVIYRRIKDFRGESSLSTWVYGIALRACYARHRKYPTKEAILDEVDDLDELDDARAGMEIADSSENPEAVYLEEESRARLMKMISSLGEKEGEAIALFYLEELDYDKISKIMNIPIGSVATVLHRARMHLHFLMLEERR